MYNYNPYMRQGAFDFYNQPIPQSQIQTINHNIPKQAQCYFVSDEKDMEKIQPSYNTVYVGLNKDKNEVYLREMNSNGLIDSKKYGLVSGVQEKDDFTKIMERLDSMENKFMKGMTNANHASNGSVYGTNVIATAS